MKKRINNSLVIGILFGFLFQVASVVQAGNASPEETLATMLRLAQAGDWESYVDKYYGEQHKFRSPSDRDKLVSRYKKKWGSRVIAGLKEASGVKPKISRDGTRAVFQLKKGAFILYKNKQGNWTYHL